MAKLSVDRYSLPLTAPLRVGKETLLVREGAIVELHLSDDAGNLNPHHHGYRPYILCCMHLLVE